jgi:transcriptional regulator with XRE-family HTH domain
MTIAELRRARMARGMSLTEISRRTRIGVGYLRSIEEGDMGRLPPGFYARAFVRAYAEAIGVDADFVVGELSDVLPPTQAAGSPHPSATGQASLPYCDAATLIPDARMQVLKQLLERHNETIGNPNTIHRPVVNGGGARRMLAASIDGAIMSGIYLGVLGMTATLCGIRIPELIRLSPIEVFTVLGLITLLYVLMMGGIAGMTIGAMLLDVPLVERTTRPLDLAAIARRSVHCLRADVTAAAEIVSLVEGLFGRMRRVA